MNLARRPSWSRLLAVSTAAVLLAGIAPLGVARPVAAATAVLASPTMTSPSSGSTVTGNPVFSWTSVSGATKYRIEISASPALTPTLVADETTNLNYTPSTELPLGTLYWRVAARDAANILGTYVSDSFDKAWSATPTPAAPVDGATLTFPTDPLLFTWGALSGAQWYELQIDDASDFIGATTYTTKNTSFVVTEPKTSGQTFYWHVRGVSGGIFSDWSTPRLFDVVWPSVPSLIYPANGATLTDVYFDWSPVPGAKTYQLQVSPNGDWANNVVIDVNVKSTRYAPPMTLNNANYFWRVRAKDAAGTANNGLWSVEPRTFQRNWLLRPTLLAPANHDFGVDVPTFSWTPVEHAAYYELAYSTDPNFLSFRNCFTNHTTVTPYEMLVGLGTPNGCSLDLVPGTTYYWHVRGIDPPVMNPGAGEPGVLGLWSNTSNADIWSFAYIPDNPVPVSPASGVTLQVPTFDWTDSSGATKYKLTVVKSNGSVAVSTDTYSTSWTPLTALKPEEGPYRWFVQAYDYGDHQSLIPAMSSWRSFDVEAISTTFSQPQQLAPAHAAPSVEMPSVRWQPVTGADHYRVWFSSNGVAYSQLGSDTDYPAFTFTEAVLSAGAYWWFVEAFDLNGAFISSSSSARTFVITEPNLLGTAGYVTPLKCLPAAPCAPIADTPTLRWNPVPGALWYRVYVAQDPNFTNIYRTYDTTFTELTPRESYLDNQAGQAYYWFVRPIRSDNTGRYDSEAQQNASAFQKRSEGLHRTAPGQDAHVPNEITFTWQDFLQTNRGLTPNVTQEAKQYRIDVSTVADFASLIDTRIIDQPFYTPFDRTYPEGPIYWRVQALDGSNNSLTFSATNGLVQKDSPPVALLYPATGANLAGVPFLKWSPQAYAAQYDVQISSDVNFSSPIITATTKMTAWSYTEPLAAGTFWWRVRRKDADNRDGPWSPARSFALQPSAPNLVSPANASKPAPSTLLFQWAPVTLAPKYMIEVSTTSTFGTLVAGTPKTTVMTRWAPTTLLPNGTYFWRVKALNASGATVATSAVRSFTINVDTVRPTVTRVDPAASAPITGAFVATFAEPVTGVDSTTFVLKPAGSGTALPGTVIRISPTSARFTPAARLVPGQMYTVSLGTEIRDLNGNQLVAYATNIRASTSVEQDSRAVRETWGRWTTTSASGGGMKVARTASSQLSFTFTGTDAALVGFRGPMGGYGTVILDGLTRTRNLNFYSATKKYRKTLWSVSGLAPGTHTLQVAPSGSRPAGSKGTWVYVDAFKVDGATIEDNVPAVTERFGKVISSSASGASYELTSHIAGTGWSTPTFTFQFSGTGVAWNGTTGPSYGKATVFIDNVKLDTVDLYRSTTAYRQTIWSSPGLSNGPHSIRISVTGKKQPASKGYDVSFDEFVIK